MRKSKNFYLNLILSAWNLLFGLLVSEKPATLLFVASVGAIVLSQYCAKKQKIAIDNGENDVSAFYRTSLIEILILLILLAVTQIADHINAMYWQSEKLGDTIFYVFIVIFFGSILWFFINFMKVYRSYYRF